ncbi:protein-disulfide reductase DsbD family protein [Sphingobacterium lumbrici]|uniref:protein-disulfide reductase DsbD family protein n=1 Tax=Sphingobacterium lumbrici TaxID=2559600 RepID=UPI0011269B4D|nr:cytochrome c biogenesis protein CcdA [Sphingobacterium lumbrici]
MKIYKHLILLAFTVFATSFSLSFAQEDTLLSFGDIEFTDGTVSEDISLADTLEDIVFSDGTDTGSQNVTPNETETVSQQNTNEKGESLWGIFIAGLIGGFAAFLMPCIFPMVPLTVSFFTKKSGSKAQAVTQALLYGVFIIVIYVALGMLITITFGAEAMNQISTNGVFNFLFFLLLVIFAASFFGAFEITLPSAFVNKIDSNSDKGGLLGLFFMSASLAVVSFSCTGPIIGTLLVEAATKGERLGPAIGMFGFSLALAIPFVLFAMFPSMLKSLPKSGGWLNSVKVVLGFLELALALKFLSNVDLAYNWQLLDREVFLSLWIVIFGLLGLYLIGKIKFAHDSPLQYLSVPRTMLTIIVFSFVVYMVPGLWGAPLKSIAAFLPPIGTQDFDVSAGVGTGTSHNTDAANRKHYTHFHSRATIKGFDPYYDYDEALAAAQEQQKPLLIDFTGWTCVNCRKMEAGVWSNQKVKDLINKEFILVELYVDEHDLKLPESEQYVSTQTGKKINTVGKKNTDFQISQFHSNSQPLYAIVNNEGELLVPSSGANYDIEKYAEYLQSGIDAYKATK